MARSRAQEKKSTRAAQTNHSSLLQTQTPRAGARISPLSATTAMPHHRHRGAAAADEAPSPRPSAAAGCYAFLTRSHRASGGYRRLVDSAPAPALDDSPAVRVEVGTTRERAKSVFHVDPAVLEAGPVRRLVAAAGRRVPGGGVAVAVDALLFEHLLWLATKAGSSDGAGTGPEDDDDLVAGDDLSEIVEFYSQDDDDDHHRGF